MFIHLGVGGENWSASYHVYVCVRVCVCGCVCVFVVQTWLALTIFKWSLDTASGCSFASTSVGHLFQSSSQFDCGHYQRNCRQLPYLSPSLLTCCYEKLTLHLLAGMPVCMCELAKSEKYIHHVTGKN